MQRINKKTADGNLIINDVLESAWNDIEKRYEGDIYYGLINDINRNKLISQFLEEQNNLCCYCMKEISSSDVSIEHIIPQNISKDEFERYLTVPELTNSLVYSRLFDRETKIIPPAQYPHDLAYNNFIASCKSSTHCNNKRGNSYIDPFFYNDNQDFNYEPFGHCNSEIFQIDPINLNTDFLLMVRKLWYLISEQLEDLSSIPNHIKLQEIIDDFIYNEDDKYIETFTGEASKIKEVFSYRWFFQYYKNNR